MTNHRFTLRSHADLVATFRKKDQASVVIPKGTPYPVSVEHYFSWTESSGAYTYLVFKRGDWEMPRGLVFQRNASGNAHSPSGMCDWCHTPGASDEIGLLTTTLTPNTIGGTWLCLDLDCIQKIEEQSGLAGKNPDQRIARLVKRIGEFYQRAWGEI